MSIGSASGSTIILLLSPLGVNRDGGLFNLTKMMVSVVHKEKDEKKKAQAHEVRGHENEDKKTNPNFQQVDKPNQISTHQVLQS